MTPAALPPAPSLRRRMACFVYEGLILFGLLLLPGVLGAALVAATGRAHPGLLGAASFLMFGAYFGWFWSRRGQTLPMQTWRIRVLGADGRPLSWPRALGRHLAAYAWFAPALLLGQLNAWPVKTQLGALAAGVFAYALLALLHPQRQFWHDALCGTCLVDATAQRAR